MKHNCFYQFWLRLLTPLGLLFFWVRYRDTKNIPQKGKLIVCCNHKSVFDPFLLAVPFRRQIRYMAKTELFTDHGALARMFLYRLGAFPVKRNTGDLKSVRTAEEILNGGGMVGIFPQGGCVFGNSPFRPKAGVALLAIQTGAPVLPVSIYCNGLLRPFKRITIRFGKIISGADFPAGGKPSQRLRDSAAFIAKRINAMLEEKH